MSSITIREAVREGALLLKQGTVAFATPALDSELLMAHTLCITRSDVIVKGGKTIDADSLSAFYRLIQCRQRGTPIAYITGIKEFYGLDFAVSPAVLIPKPDTERLVELAIEAIRKRQSPPPPSAYKTLPTAMYLPHSLSVAKPAKRQGTVAVADICCGSGCIGIAVAHECSGCIASMSFTDISQEALDVCRKNAVRLLRQDTYDDGEKGGCDIRGGNIVDMGRGRGGNGGSGGNEHRDIENKKRGEEVPLCQFLCGDLLSVFPYDKKFDIILSNPPYISSRETDILLSDGRGEPRIALDGDGDKSQDGLYVTRRLVMQAARHLFHGGVLMVESSEEGTPQTAKMMREAGLEDVAEYTDLSGSPRVAAGVKA